MTYYWENHKKRYHNGRLAWYGDDATDAFWSQYWQKRITASYYENLMKVKIESTFIGKTIQKELSTNDKIIEAGCGAGHWVSILNHHGFNDVLGIDYSIDLVKRIKEINPGLNIEYGDALNIQMTDDQVDAYLSFGVIEHRSKGPEPFLKEAYRIIRPGGKVIITVPCVGLLRKLKAKLGMYKDSSNNLPFFQYGFQKQELHDILVTIGFEIINSRYLNLDRLWLEELILYRKMARFNRIRNIQKYFSHLLEGIDGHMILIVAKKPG